MMLLEEANSKPSKKGFPQLHKDVFETTGLQVPWGVSTGLFCLEEDTDSGSKETC